MANGKKGTDLFPPFPSGLRRPARTPRVYPSPDDLLDLIRELGIPGKLPLFQGAADQRHFSQRRLLSQAVGLHLYPKGSLQLPDIVQVQTEIRLLRKDHLPVVSSLHDVVRIIRQNYPPDSRHALRPCH